MLKKMITLAAVLALLTLLAAPLVVAQQAPTGNPFEEGTPRTLPSNPAFTVPVGLDPGSAGFAQYASGNPSTGQAVPVCPGPVAPGTVRCHSLVLTPTPQ